MRQIYPNLIRNNRVIISYMCFASIPLLSSCKSTNEESKSNFKADEELKPNIIFILTDDQGYGDMGVADHPYMKTPNIDRLASEGTRFTQFYVNATVSAPSRVALMTGHFPARNNVHHIYGVNQSFSIEHGVPKFLDPNIYTIADMMKSAGYTTAHFGKWHLSGNRGESPEPTEYGFDSWKIVNFENSPNYAKHMENDEYFRANSTRLFVDDAINFIEKNKNSDKPFYLNLWTLLPHSPLRPTPEDINVYKDFNGKPSDFDSYMQNYAKGAKSFKSQMQIYMASVTALDRDLGYLIKYLDEKGLTDNTIFIFSSDNGPEDYHIGNSSNAGMGSPGNFRGRKRSTYEGGVRVPCIIRWPGYVPAGKVSSSVWSGVDLLPTLAKIVELDLPSDFQPDGEDVSDIFFGSDREHYKPIFWEWKFNVAGNQQYNPPQLAIRKGDWKFFCNSDGGQMELYDLSNDPTELNNIADQNFETAQELKRMLLNWKETIPESAYTEDSVILDND